jgi:hypothetical protein
MRRLAVAAAATILTVGIAACSHDPAAPSVPHLAGSAGSTAGDSRASAGPDDNSDDNPNAVAGDASAQRRAKLHTAAECVRQHGATGYQDPILTADGYVYTDDVALRALSGPQLDTITTVCQSLIHAANFSVRDQGPPPPELIRAGVRSAQCMRAHGLPDFKDPTVHSRFSTGKGFGLTSDEIPPGGKQNPTLQQAIAACRTILDEEARLSSLGNLGHA